MEADLPLSSSRACDSAFNSHPSVLMVAAELAPFAKTGGLGDMVAAIARSLIAQAAPVTVLLPGYPALLAAVAIQDSSNLGDFLGHPMHLVLADCCGIQVAIVRCDGLYNRPGGIYLDQCHQPWPDNFGRFAALGKVASMIANGRTPHPPPRIVHLNDWHSGMYFAFGPPRSIPTVLTVHNFAFQGRFSEMQLAPLKQHVDMDVVRSGAFFGGYSPLKIACEQADFVSTVSDGYCRELLTPTRYNRFQLSDLTRRRMISIPNWLDRTQWNPTSDRHITARFDADSLAARKENRNFLLEWLSISGEKPIFCTISRITRAKGFRFLLRNLDAILSTGSTLVVVGDGEPRLLNGFKDASLRYPGQLRVITPYSDRAAHRLLAGADMLIMPSLVEPCGLSQLHAQAYGCVPIASAVGGLSNSITTGGGFLFEPSDLLSFRAAIADAIMIYDRPEEWRKVQIQCMNSHRAETGLELGYFKLFSSIAHASATKDRKFYN